MSGPQSLSGKSVKLPTFFLGKNRRRRWVVQDPRGLCRALFVKQAEAMRFAMYASRGRPRAVTMVPGVFELNVDDAERVRVGARPETSDRHVSVETGTERFASPLGPAVHQQQPTLRSPETTGAVRRGQPVQRSSLVLRSGRVGSWRGA